MSEQVVLLDGAGHAIGTHDKSAVHHAATPLHLAFSCYVFNTRGEFLLTRRALGKRTWPGVWTNSCCGHPAPGEPFLGAVHRRVGQELGVVLEELRLVLPDFRYRAVMDDGVVEHEICPVTVGVTDGEPAPDPAEVESATWVDWATWRRGVLDGTAEVSPWALRQVRALPEDPLRAAVASSDELPPAARGMIPG